MSAGIEREMRLVALLSSWLVALAVAVLSAQSGALVVERQGDRLRLSAPQFHFLEGRPLEQLHDGAALPFVFSVSVEPANWGGRSLHLQERFVISYDLWEEKFSVVREGQPRRAVSHLTAAAAEAWCLDSLALPVSAVPAAKSFVVKLAGSVVDVEEAQAGGDRSTLSTLIDFFSRKGAAAAPPRWELVSKPLRLADLKDGTRR